MAGLFSFLKMKAAARWVRVWMGEKSVVTPPLAPIENASKISTVHFEYPSDENNWERSLIQYENGDSEQLKVTNVGHDLYRLEESAFVGEGVYGDTVHASVTADGSLLFVEIVERSSLETHSRVLSPATLSSEAMKKILNTVMESGGMWEQAFGGYLIIHTPPSITKTISTEIAKLSRPHNGCNY